MTTISLIAAIDEARGIGFNNQLLVHLPADLKYFKSVTMGKPIIMGRRTYESIGRPLPGRKNIIISSTLSSQEEITVVPTLNSALEQVNGVEEAMIIGGARLFEEGINLATRLYITKIKHHFKADVHFPVINPEIWKCKKQSLFEHDEQNPFDMTFCVYERNDSSPL